MYGYPQGKSSTSCRDDLNWEILSMLNDKIQRTNCTKYRSHTSLERYFIPLVISYQRAHASITAPISVTLTHISGATCQSDFMKRQEIFRCVRNNQNKQHLIWHLQTAVKAVRYTASKAHAAALAAEAEVLQ